MPRIVGKEIPGDKRLEVSLTYIYGIGRTLARELLCRLGFDGNKRAKQLSLEEIASINELLQREYLVEGNLSRKVQEDILHLMRIGSYRGRRHREKLPVRGQRTSTNARTRKGKKKTIANKKK